MPIGIKGIRLDSINIKPTEEADTIEASYSLISTADKVLAKQSIGGYNGMAIQPSPNTIEKLRAFMSAYKSDVQITLGLDAQ